MAQIEKIENVMVDNKIDKVVMSINDGGKLVEGEVYLAFVDTNTNKRYMIYTTEKAKSENDRIPFSLSTLVYENNGYVLEETSKEDHDKIEIPILNVIGMKAKTTEEAEQLLQKEFPSIAVVSVQPLVDNVQNRMTISETKPPKKASMPMVVANVIKKYYLHQLNKELKKIYDNSEMTEAEKDQSVQKLDKIEEKLDSLKEVYEEHINPNEANRSIEKNLDEIETAKQDIVEAKNKLNLQEETIPADEELPDVSLENHLKEEVSKTISEEHSEEPVKDEESEEVSVDDSEKQISKEPVSPSIEEIVEHPEKNIETKEEPMKNNIYQAELNNVEERIQEVIDKSVNTFAVNFENIVKEISNGIVAIYQEQLAASNSTIEQLRIQLQEQIENSQQERMNLVSEIQKLGEKATEVNEQAIQSKKTVEGLEQKLNSSVENEKKLTTENENLKTEVSSQKQQLDQQNRLIDSLREESNTRDQKHQEENNKLQEENARLKEENTKIQEENRSLRGYKEGYEQMRNLFDRFQKNQNPAEVGNSTVDEVVDRVLDQNSPQK